MGLSAEVGKTKIEMFDFIKERVLQRLTERKEEFLNQAGKEILIKHAALALPIYAMMSFKMPDGLLRQIEAAMARFWWGEKSNEEKIHWMRWSRLCKPKFKGGLGF